MEGENVIWMMTLPSIVKKLGTRPFAMLKYVMTILYLQITYIRLVTKAFHIQS